tara:strand:+ start:513 stop:800 length:288 start_codon:yes stop_codon:yes gene_type:complete
VAVQYTAVAAAVRVVERVVILAVKVVVQICGSEAAAVLAEHSKQEEMEQMALACLVAQAAVAALTQQVGMEVPRQAQAAVAAKATMQAALADQVK